jgi:leucyl/phenylalanyl-tRNA--protein transferase
MRHFLHMLSRHAAGDPIAILWHQICGRMCNWTAPTGGYVRWHAESHRGVQWLHKVQFPRKQKRYIFSPQFEIRYDTEFEEVVKACSDRGSDDRSWVTPDVVRGLVELHKMGFAHSFEAWHEGKLVGGAFGTQLGSMITCDSMFHRMSNASKAAYGQALVHLQNRGFKIVDTNGVANHQVNYGEEWMPRWQFERLIYECLDETPSIRDDRPCPTLPWKIRALLPILKTARLVARRLPLRKPIEPAPPSSGQSEPTAPVTRASSPCESTLKTNN